LLKEEYVKKPETYLINPKEKGEKVLTADDFEVIAEILSKYERRSLSSDCAGGSN